MLEIAGVQRCNRIAAIFVHLLVRRFQTVEHGAVTALLRAATVVVPLAHPAVLMAADIVLVQFDQAEEGLVDTELESKVVETHDIEEAGMRRFGNGTGHLAAVANQHVDGMRGFQAGGVIGAGLLGRAFHLVACVLGTGDDGVDQGGNLAGGLAGAFGQLADLIGHHGKTASLLAGTRSLDRCVQRQQIGLVGNVVDQLHEAADIARVFGQGIDAGCGLGLGADHVVKAVGNTAQRSFAAAQRLCGLTGGIEFVVELPGQFGERGADGLDAVTAATEGGVVSPLTGQPAFVFVQLQPGIGQFGARLDQVLLQLGGALCQLLIALGQRGAFSSSSKNHDYYGFPSVPARAGGLYEVRRRVLRGPFRPRKRV